MPSVRIYQPAKSAMQSGRARTRHWVVEFEADSARGRESLMGWTSSADTRRQVRLSFETREQAIAYAEEHGYDYTVLDPAARIVRPKSYADNFSAGRRGNWTH